MRRCSFRGNRAYLSRSGSSLRASRADAVGTIAQLSGHFDRSSVVVPAGIGDTGETVRGMGFGRIIANADRNLGMERANHDGTRAYQGFANHGFYVVSHGMFPQRSFVIILASVRRTN
jgi:hypothetical protein